GRGRQFLTDWVPYLILFFSYEVMRNFAGRTGFKPHDLSGLESALFFGHIPTFYVQGALYHAGQIEPWDVAAITFYFMHFALPIVVGFVFWLRSRREY